jgi:hypothetical protein
MNFKPYKYQISLVISAVILTIVSYMAVIEMIDSIMSNYEIYSSTRAIADDPQSIDRRQERLSHELSEKKAELEVILSRKDFSQDIFRELAQDYRCRLVKFENRDILEKEQIEYKVSFSGSVKRLLNLLHKLETGYFVKINRVIFVPDDEAGTRVRMAITMAAGNNEG